MTVFFFSVSNYFPDHTLPENVVATTDAKSALRDADYCLHAVPVQVIRICLFFLIPFNIWILVAAEVVFDASLSLSICNQIKYM